MLRFEQFPYHRPDVKELSQRLLTHIQGIQDAQSLGACFYHLVQGDLIDRTFTSYAVRSEAGSTCNTLDPFYQQEEAYFNQEKPAFEMLMQQLGQALYHSPFREDLSQLLGREFFDRIGMRLKIQSDQALPLLQKENELSQAYSQMMAAVSVKEGGQTLSLSELSRLMDDPSGQVRRHHARLMETALLQLAPRLDSLYDQLVQLRNTIAVCSGFSNYTDYCLHKHARTSYGRRELDGFADTVMEHVVPVVQLLMAHQAKRLGRPLMNYDENQIFPGQDLKVPEDPLPAFTRIFSALSPHTQMFFEELCQRQFFDLKPREGKLQGAYSNYVPLSSMPFVFESYNATQGAFKTFAHECGHGLHAYLHRGQEVLAASACSSDVAEVHAMAMEFFIWPELENIFEQEELLRYCYRQLQNSLVFICYGTAIDRFQTQVYDQPGLSSAERLQLWKKLEQSFLPWRQYEKDLFMDQGRAWQRQIHVMKWPFYYIDYVLAQVCALQFFAMNQKDHEQAWSTYLAFIKDSGRYAFSELLAKAGLASPFEPGLLQGICQQAQAFLDDLEP